MINIMNKNLKFIFLLILGLFIIFTNPAQAVEYYEENPDFNQNCIIADTDMTSYNSMGLEDIQEFLDDKDGALATYVDPENNQSAAWIIWSTAQEYLINPKFLLTLLQKEQSLITDPDPSANQYDWAVGYSCYGGTCIDDYQGFTTQLRSASNKFINTYMDSLNETGCTFTNWCVGKTKKTQDDVLVTPENKATASLYTYNPYRGGTVVNGLKIGANYNFWKIWNSWFASSMFYPDGTLLKSSTEPTVWLISNGYKRAFNSWTSLVTRYDAGNIIIVPSYHLDNYPEGSIIKYPQYALLADPDGNKYLLENDYKRKIYDQATFQVLGFNPEEVIPVDQDEVDSIPSGQVITVASSYPLGGLLQSTYNGAVYYVQNGTKYPVVHSSIMEVNYPGLPLNKVSVDELETYPTGPAIKFRDGTLIKGENNPSVYVVSDGKKLLIASEETFNSLGYHWGKIITTTQAVLDIHPTGDTLDFTIE